MTSQMDNFAKDIFLKTLKSILLKKGYKECCSEYSFNKFKSTYSIDLVNSFGTMQTYIFEIHGVPLNNELLLYGFLVEPSECNKGVSIRIRLKLNQDVNLLNSNIENKFVAKLKELASPSIDDLPVEIKLHFLKYLTVESLVSLSQTNHTWYNLINKSNIWKLLCKRDFDINTKQDDEEWQDVYKTEHERRYRFHPKYIIHSLPDSFPPLNDIIMERDRYMYNYFTSRTPFF